MKKLIYILIAVAAVTWATSCKHLDEEPKLNEGYATEYRVPDPEPLTDEDKAVIAAQKAEYEENAK